MPSATGEETCCRPLPACGVKGGGWRGRGGGGLLGVGASTYGLDLDGSDEHPLFRRHEAEPLPVLALELGPHRVGLRQLDRQGRVRALVAQMQLHGRGDLVSGQPIRRQLG